MEQAIRARAGRDNNFHLIRHGAAIAVVLTHSFAVVTGSYASEPLVALFGASIGHYAVDVFFVLSGFLIAQSLTRDPDPVRYVLSRALRIVPALLLAVAFAALFIGPVVSALEPGAYFADGDLARYIVGAATTLATDRPLPGVFSSLPEAGTVNAPLWTLKYEILAYVSVGFLAFFRPSPRLSFLPIALVLIVLSAAAAADPQSIATPADNGAHLLLAFYLGAAFWLLRRQIPLSLPGVIILFGIAVLARDSFAAALAEKLFIAYAAIWLAFLPSRLSRLMEPLGDASYGLYIYAFPVQQTLRLAFPAIDPMTLFATTLALVVPLAFASWHLVEKPCLAARSLLAARLKPGERAPAVPANR